MPITNSTRNYQSSKYIVDADGTSPYATIQSAIDQVVLDAAGGFVPSGMATIEIRPGIYSENLSLYAQVNLTGCCDASVINAQALGQVIIDGVHTPPLADSIQFSNIVFTSATDILFSAAAGSCDIGFINCTFACIDGYAANLDQWTGNIIIDGCTDISMANGILANTTGAALEIRNSTIGATGHTLVATGPVSILRSSIFCPLRFDGITCSVLIDSSVIDSGDSIADPITGVVAIIDPLDVKIQNSTINATSAPCLITSSVNTTTLANVVINTANNPAIDGTGQLEIGEVVFLQDNTIAGTVVIEHNSELAMNTLRIEGNLELPDTDITGLAGEIVFGGDRWISNFDIHNTFVGELSGNTSLTAGVADENTGIGYNALNSITNSACCTALGSGALASILTGVNTVAIGSGAGSAYVGAESNNILISNPGVAAETETIRIGEFATQTSNYQAGIYQASSGAIKEVCYIDNTGKLSSSNLGITQWITATASLTAASNTGYIVKMAIPGLCTITLPALSAVGDVIEITGYTVGGWTIAQGALQQIHFIAASTTLGALGELMSTNRYDSVKIVCVTQNTDWNVISSSGVLIIA